MRRHRARVAPRCAGARRAARAAPPRAWPARSPARREQVRPRPVRPVGEPLEEPRRALEQRAPRASANAAPGSAVELGDTAEHASVTQLPRYELTPYGATSSGTWYERDASSTSISRVTSRKKQRGAVLVQLEREAVDARLERPIEQRRRSGRRRRWRRCPTGRCAPSARTRPSRTGTPAAGRPVSVSSTWVEMVGRRRMASRSSRRSLRAVVSCPAMGRLRSHRRRPALYRSLGGRGARAPSRSSAACCRCAASSSTAAGAARAAGSRSARTSSTWRRRTPPATRRRASSSSTRAASSECEILLAYGSVDFSSKVGQLGGNHFLTLDDGLEQLPELGRRVLWQGAQPISIEEVGADAGRLESDARSSRPVRGGRSSRASGSFAGRRRVSRTAGSRRSASRRSPADRRRPTGSIDATGLLVLPGVVDVHTHTRIPSDASPTASSRTRSAAAFGGHDDVPRLQQPGHRHQRGGPADAPGRHRGVARRDRRRERRRLRAVRGHHRAAGGPEADLAAAVDAGVPTLQVLPGLRLRGRRGAARRLLPAWSRRRRPPPGPRRGPGPAGRGHRRAARGGRTRPRHHAASRPPAVEATGTRTAIEIAPRSARPCTSCTSRAAARVARSPRRGARASAVYAETCPHYLVARRVALRRCPTRPSRAASSRRRCAPAPTRTRSGRRSPTARWTWSPPTTSPTGSPSRSAGPGQPFTEVSNGAPGIETLLPVV